MDGNGRNTETKARGSWSGIDPLAEQPDAKLTARPGMEEGEREFRKYAPKLAAYLRDSVRQRQWPRGEEHLAPCERCATLLLELRVDHHRPPADRQIREPPVISAFPPRRLPTPRPGHRAAAGQATTRTNFLIHRQPATEMVPPAKAPTKRSPCGSAIKGVPSATSSMT